MSSAKVLTCLLLLAGCAQQPPGAAPPQPGAEEPFEVSSIGSRYTLRGHFIGTLRLRGNSLEVFATEGRIETAGTPRPGSVRYRDVRVSAGIGSPSGTSWSVRAMSPARSVQPALEPGEIIRLDSLRFVIAGIRRTDIRRRWLVFQFAAQDADDGQPFTTYACSQFELFAGQNMESERGARLSKNYESTC